MVHFAGKRKTIHLHLADFTEVFVVTKATTSGDVWLDYWHSEESNGRLTFPLNPASSGMRAATENISFPMALPLNGQPP